MTADDELLQYAALTYDYGVFKGNDGQLMPSSYLTSENAALVAVRAYSVLKEVDLIKYVKDKGFTSNYSDRLKGSVDGKRAMDVIDYFEVIDAESFSPKNTATCANFATFFYYLNQQIPIILKRDEKYGGPVLVSYEQFANKLLLKLDKVIEDATTDDFTIIRYVDGVAQEIKPTSIYISKT
ncbi:MAG: hypothetical protein RR651_00295 [Lysinibacillus sp.]